MIARMAGNIAAGLVTTFCEEDMERFPEHMRMAQIAGDSVDLAVKIVDEIWSRVDPSEYSEGA